MTTPANLGRYFYALALIGSGIQQIVRADFVRIVSKLPAWIPWQPGLAIAVGVGLIAAGTAILVGNRARTGALVAAGLLAAAFVFQRIPEIFANPGTGFVWTNPAKVLALLGGALMIAARDPGAPAPSWLASAARSGPILLGTFLFICGFQHYYYADFVDTLVPAWLGHPRFWTLFTGTCLLAGGAGLFIPPTQRVAAICSGVMIFFWILLLHIPRAIALRSDPGETSAIFEALAISGVAFLVAVRRNQRVILATAG